MHGRTIKKSFFGLIADPSQQAALQQVGIMKRELAELRSELAVREQDMYKDETQLQSEVFTVEHLLLST